MSAQCENCTAPLHTAIMLGDVHLIFFFVIFVFIIVAAIFLRRQGGRNAVLERWIAQGKCGPVSSFEGTLAVEQSGSGYLRLATTEQAKSLQFRYRWMSAIREQAGYDEVIFDRSRHVVELKRKDKVTMLPFARFSAIRMREISQQEAGSLWHFDLVETGGKYVLFVSTARGDRRLMFENSAGLAKDISDITALPVQVVLSGQVWTPGWPPKDSIES